MKFAKVLFVVICITCFGSLFFVSRPLADVAPGDVINKSNWQKAEGLVPESMLNWLKNGEIVLNIGTLNYSPGEVSNSLIGGEKVLKENVGKYVIKNYQLVDAKTGKEPGFVEGIPFPNLDPKDPELGIKFMYNRDYIRFAEGNVDLSGQFQFITPGGFEREASFEYYQYPFDGYRESKNRSNPDGLWRYNLYVFRTPFDIAGTSMMTWRYRRAEQDMNFAYVPSIRRVRRMTPANRSDSIIGSDICWDDAFGYDGKPDAFDWKVVKVGEGLIPFLSENPQKIVKDPQKGGWMTTKDIKAVAYGYQKADWTGAKWAPLNLVWVKRPVYVIEARSRDPYYNFGPQTIWFDAETPHAFVRDVTDRSGKYWKSMICSSGCLQNETKDVSINTFTTMQMMDSRTKRATIVEVVSPRNIWHYFTNSDSNKFSLAGYASFCK